MMVIQIVMMIMIRPGNVLSFGVPKRLKIVSNCLSSDDPIIVKKNNSSDNIE